MVLGALRIVLDVLSTIYLSAAFRIPYIVSDAILTPINTIHYFLWRFCLGGWICSIWLIFRIGFKLYGLREGSKRRSKKKTQRQSVINCISAKLCALKTPLQNVETVLSLSLNSLYNKVTTAKELSCLDTVEALQVHLIRLMESQSSSVAEIVFDADVIAIFLDQKFKKTGKPLSALHGVPVCLSNSFAIKGEDCNASVVFKVGRSVQNDCSFVSNLKAAGAIPVALACTGVLPSCPDASSGLYQTVPHPTHADRVVGSTAIGVIVKQKGAFLGFGVDVLGDVRSSASNIGIVGFKPTPYRFSVEGVVYPVSPPQFLDASVGTVGLNVGDVTVALEALTSIPRDPVLPIIPFKPSNSDAKLTIGVYKNCPTILPVVPGVERMMEEVVIALKNRGHKVVEIELPDPHEGLMLILQCLLTTDEYWNVHVKNHHGCSLTWSQVFQCYLPKVCPCLRSILSPLISVQQRASCPAMKRLLGAWKNPLSDGALREGLEAYRRKFSDVWEDEGIDIIVGPASPAPALLKSSSASLAFLQTGYSSIFNIVGCPAGVVPFTTTTKADVQAAVEAKPPRNSLEEQLLKQQKTAEGLPMSVQVVAKPWADDKALALMKELEGISHL